MSETTVIFDEFVQDGDLWILVNSERITEGQLWEIRMKMNWAMYREEFTKRFMIGEEIPYAVTKNLDYMASQYGYQSGDDMLQAILISMNR